jgi:flagellin
VLNGTTTFGASGATVVLDTSHATPGTTFAVTGGSGLMTVIATTATSASTATATLADVAKGASEIVSFGNLGLSLTVTASSGAGETSANVSASAIGNITIAAGVGNANFQIGAGATDSMAVNFDKVDLVAGTTGNGTNAAGSMDALASALSSFNTSQTVANSQALISAVDSAINYVSSIRGTLGASQNRLEHTISNLGVAQENMTASESRIRDVDMAHEMVQFTKTGILQQAGQAILAQANQAPAGVMSLLR